MHPWKTCRLARWLLGPLVLLGAAAAVRAQPSVYVEDLTTSEVAAALQAGRTTVIVPVGGTEQSGPHMALGKHNVRATLLAGRIAHQLGDALVAPTVNYVPEGRVQPPEGHMRFAGTLSIPDDVFTGLLRGAAQSLRQHGFRHIVLVGDHGGYQNLLQATAARLNREWAGGPGPARVHYIAAYYRAASAGFAQQLRAKGLSEAQIGEHAGTADTSLMLALEPRLVRADQLAEAARSGAAGGTRGDPRAASAALGQTGVDGIVADTVTAIKAARAAAP
ncbi:MAG TPA: creatininase family protein [Burkholderiaceae bacterium]|nr:creatininase family protein [Burkholderiaceae bacterium]